MFLTYTNLAGVSYVLSNSEKAAVLDEICNIEKLSVDELILSVNCVDFASANLKSGDHIESVFALEGGKKGKKKKKNYTTPKHVSHKKKKVKLAVLRNYSINKEEVVSRRLNCIAGCPAGVKMAEHKDRLYCGRCHVVKFKKTN